MSRIISILVLTAGTAVAQEPFRVTVWKGAGDQRLIPTNRWIWMETRKGIFAPEPNGPLHRDWIGIEETEAESEVALDRLADVIPSERAEGLWCIDWQTKSGAPRLACME